MAQNAERFLNLFNELEKYLKGKYNHGDYAPFRQLVRMAGGREAIVKRYREDLFTYGDLRNVMVHNSRINGRTIAEPLDEIVDRFEKMWEQIQHPEKVSVFIKPVFACFAGDSLEKALRLLSKHKISQIPVLQNGKIYDMINGYHIATWLSGKNIVKPAETTIAEVMEQGEHRHNFEIIPANMSVFDAAEIYRQSYRKPPLNWYYDALLITQNGRSDEELTGIIVLKDIAGFLHE